MDVGYIIKSARIAKGYTQEQVADNVSEPWLMGYDVPSRPEREEVEIIKDPNAENEQWLIDIFRSLPDEDKSTLMSFALYLEQQAIYKNVSENADVLPTENIA